MTALAGALSPPALLRIALAWGYITDDRAARVKLRRLLALCWGLTNGPHRATK